MTLLESLDLRPPLPVENSRFPILGQASARGMLDRVTTSASVTVIRLGGICVVSTWTRDRSRLDSHEIPGRDGHAVLEDPTPHQLGVAMRTAADAVQP